MKANRSAVLMTTLALLLPCGVARADCSVDRCDGPLNAMGGQADGNIELATSGTETNLSFCDGSSSAIFLKPSHPRFAEIHQLMVTALALRLRVVIYVKNTPGQPCEVNAAEAYNP